MTSIPRAKRLFGSVGLWALVATVAATTSCIKEYDMERSDPQRGTLGEELHRIWVKDTARSATDAQQRTELLEQREDDFVSAVDRTVPEQKVHELDEFLQSLLPIIEQDRYVPALTRRVEGVLREAANDDQLLSNLDDRPPYRASQFVAPGERGAAIEDALDYEPLAETVSALATVFLAHDGFDDEGQPQLGASSYTDLLRAIAEQLEQSQPDRGSDRLANAFGEIFTRANSVYRIGEDAPRSHHVAKFDDRGLPKVRQVDGEIPAPFVDEEGNGRADVDEQGRFILEDSSPMAIPPLSHESVRHPELLREPFGRVRIGPGEYAFEYVDISNTALPYLLQLTVELIDREVLYDLLQVHREVLGPTEGYEDNRGSYQGYTDEHPFIDIADAVLSTLAIDSLPEVGALAARYLRRNVDELAFVAYSFGEAAEHIVEHPSTDIYSDQTVINDALEVLREITADPELWADVMDALRDPVVTRTGEAVATLIQYRDQRVVPAEFRGEQPETTPGYDDCFHECKGLYDIGTEERFDCIRDTCMSGELFSNPTQFGEPESEQNRSVAQRLFHLLRDTSGVEYELRIEELEEPWLNMDPQGLPSIVTLPGAAEAFLRSVAGKLHLEDYISEEFEDSGLGALFQMLNWLDSGDDLADESLATILSSASSLFGFHLDTEPTPDQITRLFNQTSIETDFSDEDLEEGEDEEDDVYIKIEDPRCHDGFVMAEHHADGLFAAEASGLIDVIHPLAVAFARHDREDLLAQLFVVVHDHYSAYDDLYRDASGDPSPMKGSNLASAEEPMMEAFADGAVFEALHTLAVSTEEMTDEHGIHADERMRELVYQLIRDDDGYAPRTHPHTVELNDGRELDNPSRLEVMLDRLTELVERHDDDEVQDRLVDAGEAFFDVVLSAEQIDDEEYRFNERGIVVLLSHLLEYASDRGAELRARGDLDEWMTQRLPDGFADFYSSRGFFAANRLLWGVHQDKPTRQLMEGLVRHLTETPARSDHLSMLLYASMVAAYDIDAYLPTARVLVDALDPDRQIDVEPHQELPSPTLVMRLLEMLPEVDDQGYALEMLQRGIRGSETHAPPLTVITEILARYFSLQPTSEQPLERGSWEAIFERIADWIGDDLNGMERFYELVEMRGNMELEPME